MGGGTPTVLAPAQLDLIFAALHESFRILPEAEITSEANPGTVDQARFQTLRRLGVNRLSMGVQSFDETELAFLGRIHDAGDAVRAFELARQVGFDNINLDLMFGLPGQNPETWRATLEKAITLGPEHLSLYSLIVEPDTPLAAWVARGQVAEPDPDLAADLYEWAGERLTGGGYQQYEISQLGPRLADAGDSPHGWNSTAFACRHNLVYWRNEPYLGLGPGAHSFEGGRRWSIVRSVEAYIAGTANGGPAHDYEETIDRPLEIGETMMLGLRLVNAGVEQERFRTRFGDEIAAVYPDQLRTLTARGSLEVTPERVRLTPPARLLGNLVFAEFLPDT